ncbi:unnamed protein product [Heligmosomoides polygyrus]|uniref:Leucine--tRNA ligase n=1 Tax=Heligmosomoides polygyrus TaxID=6339 RepID=A0A183GI79_HELPZ|nr:unnamed protein product [Heligmosomoides polygyrus]
MISSGRCDRLAMSGLKLNVKKAEYLTTDVNESGSIKVNDIELPRTSLFKYLGSAIASDGGLIVEVNSCLSAAWCKWRSLTGVLCDRMIAEHLESKICRAVVRPVAKYGSECWHAAKDVETPNVVETKMLRWTAGVTRMDRIRNDVIGQKFGVAPIADKMREALLQWYGHVLRGKEVSVRKIELELEVLGKRPRGRPKQCWPDALHMDMKVTGVHPDQAQDRERYLNYGDAEWKSETRKALAQLNTYSDEVRQVRRNFEATIDWLHEHACSRSYGLGTKLPWDPQYLIESLSDSTIYNAYYTVAHLLQQGALDGSVVGPAKIRADQMTEPVWDYVFLGCAYNAETMPVEEEKLKSLRKEFLYWLVDFAFSMRCRTHSWKICYECK